MSDCEGLLRRGMSAGSTYFVVSNSSLYLMYMDWTNSSSTWGLWKFGLAVDFSRIKKGCESRTALLQAELHRCGDFVLESGGGPRQFPQLICQGGCVPGFDRVRERC